MPNFNDLTIFGPHNHPMSLDSADSVENFITAAAKDFGRKSIAVTDHGLLAGITESYEVSKNLKKKNIDITIVPGIELYLLPESWDDTGYAYYHLTVHLQDFETYIEACKLSKPAFDRAKYKGGELKPLTTWDELRSLAGKITVYSSCMVGVVQRPILKGRKDISERYFKQLIDIAGPGKFFGEIFPYEVSTNWNGKTKAFEPIVNECVPDGRLQIHCNNWVKFLCEKYNVPMLLSEDAHYAHADSKSIQDLRLNKDGQDNWKMSDANCLHTTEWLYNEMMRIHPDWMNEDLFREMVDNSHKAFGNFKSFDQKVRHHLPKIEIPHVHSENCNHSLSENDKLVQYTIQIILKKNRIDLNDPVYKKRLQHEIKQLAYNDDINILPYFLFLEIVVDWCENNEVQVGPGRGCLTGDALVLTDLGYKELKEIKTGDKVYTHTGSLKDVIDVMEYDSSSEDLLEIRTTNQINNIKLTKDHKIFGVKRDLTDAYKNATADSTISSVRKYKEFVNNPSWNTADSYSEGDLLFMPYLKYEKMIFKDLDLAVDTTTYDDEYIYCDMKYSESEKLLLKRNIPNISGISRNEIADIINEKTTVREETKNKLMIALKMYGVSLEDWLHSKKNGSIQKKIPRFIKVDEDFSYLIGRWIGDGWVVSNGHSFNVGIAFHSDDVSIEKVERILSNIGFSSTRSYSKTKKLVQLYVYNKELALLFRRLFPEYKNKSNSKYIGIFKNLSKNCLRRLLLGLQDSDGHFNEKENRECIDTTSKKLRNDIKECLLKLDISSNVVVRKECLHPKNNKYVCKESYRVTFKGLSSGHTSEFDCENGYFVEILKINTCKSEKVYDITVRDDHSYLTSNYAVHNSAAGSLLSYGLGLTNVDPIVEDLSFERFFDVSRVKEGLADIDTDFSDREKVVMFIKKRWGDKFAYLGIGTTFKTKSALKDIDRLLHGEVRKVTEDVCRTIPQSPQGVMEDMFLRGYTDADGVYQSGELEKNEILKNYLMSNAEAAKMLFKMTGIVRQMGRHAAGIIVSDVPVAEFIPLTKISGEPTTQLLPKWVEKAGAVKYDILGVSTLEDQRLAIKNIEIRHGVKINPWKLPNDPKVWENIADHPETIFQLHTVTVREGLQRMRPKSIQEAAILTSVFRPGAMDAKSEDNPLVTMDAVFLNRWTGMEPVKYIHDDVIPYLSNSVGVCIGENNEVITTNGLKKIKDIDEGEFVLTENGEYNVVKKKINNGIKPVLTIRTQFGIPFTCTEDHKVLTARGWIPAHQLHNRDLIKMHWMEKEKKDIGNIQDWIIGLILADGNVCAKTISIYCGSEDFAIKVKNYAEMAFKLQNVNIKQRGTKNVWVVSLAHNFGGQYSKECAVDPLTEKLRLMDIMGKDCYNKTWPAEYTLMTIAGFIEGDGCLKNGIVRLKNKALARGLYLALQAYRIPSSCYVNHIDGADTVFLNDYKRNIPFMIKKYETTALRRGVYFPKEYLNTKINKSRKINNRRMSCPSIMKKLDFIGYSPLKDLGCTIEHEYWSKILTINKSDKNEIVYDLHIDTNHSFTAGGHVVHNCVYQEQIMKIVHELGGLTMVETQKLRKAISKKSSDDLINLLNKVQKNLISQRGWTEDQATKLTEQMKASGRYSFNKSHAVSYSYIAYACGYLKYYYPSEWWAAVLTNADKDDLKRYWPHVSSHMLMPSVDESTDQYKIIDGPNGDYKILPPLGMIDGIGTAVFNELMEKRPFISLSDFLGRVDRRIVNKKILIKLIFSGCIDYMFGKDDNELQKIQTYLNMKARLEGKKNPEPVPEEYRQITHLQKELIKKSVYKVYNSNLLEASFSQLKLLGLAYEDQFTHLYKYIDPKKKFKNVMIVDANGYDYVMKQDAVEYFCIVGYVADSKEKKFGGNKAAMTFLIELEDRVIETIKFPDWGQNHHGIRESLKNNACLFLFRKKNGKLTVQEAIKIESGEKE